METNYFNLLKMNGIQWLPSTRKKQPALSSYANYFENPPTDSEYKEWMQGIQEGKYDGIQIMCGKVSNNLLVLDFDNKFKNSKDENTRKEGEEIVKATVRAVLGKDVDSLKNETWVSSTIHQGYHVHYFVEKGVETEIEDFNIGVEMKGERSLSKEYPSAAYTNLSSPENIRELSKEEYKRLIEKLETIKKNWKFIEPILEYWQLGRRHDLALGFSAFLRKKLNLTAKETLDIILFIAKYRQDEEPNERIRDVNDTYKQPIDEAAIHYWIVERANLQDLYKQLYSMLPKTTTSNKNIEENTNEQQSNEQSKRDKRINDFIEDFLHNHNVIAMPNSHDLYIYDDESGIWRSGEDILFKEAANQLSDSLTKNSLSDILLRIQGRTLIDDDKFNKQHKIGLLNGALDLETGEIIEPRPEFYITKQIQVKYDPNVSPDKILKFIWDIAKPSAKKFLRLLEIAAWPLLPGYPIQKAIVLIGDGYNGKSTFLSLLRKFYGDKNVSTLTLQDLSKDFLKAELYNKVANISPDLPSSSISDTGDFKWATGGSDVKTAQRKYKTATLS